MFNKFAYERQIWLYTPSTVTPWERSCILVVVSAEPSTKLSLGSCPEEEMALQSTGQLFGKFGTMLVHPMSHGAQWEIPLTSRVIWIRSCVDSSFSSSETGIKW